VYFDDPRHGWAFAEEGHEGDEHPVFFATIDGGRHWRRSPTPIEDLLLPAASASFAPAGTRLVYALVKQQGDTAENFGLLLRSDNGGRTWRRTAKAPPQAGQITFESSRDGWLASGFPAPNLWRTEDAGASWSEVHVAPPPKVERVDSESFLPPRIAPDHRGLLAAVFVARPSRDTTAALYATDDGGGHWRMVATVPLPGAGGSLEAHSVLAFRGKGAVVVHPPTKPRLTVLTLKGRGASRASKGLAAWPEMSFSGGRFGFASSIFRPDRGLDVTGDGGRSWHHLSRIRVDLGGRPAGWRECVSRRDLGTEGVDCATAATVRRRYFNPGPKINPGLSPPGWRCRQWETGHTSDGGDAYLDICHSASRPERRFRFRWTSSLE
jgi:photosystem II stability/assembly factor-like uncharacterized protein